MKSVNVIVSVVLVLNLALINSVFSKKKGDKRGCRLHDINRLEANIFDRLDMLHSENKCLETIKGVEDNIVALEDELATVKALYNECLAKTGAATIGPMTTPESPNPTTPGLPKRNINTEFPEIVQHPKDTVALVGDTVNLTCRAIGKPTPETYEWFKNGKVLTNKEQKGQNLLIAEVIIEDKGSYYCKASTEFGSARSNVARLDIKEDSESFCDSQPVQLLKALPKDCPQGEKSSLVYDVGRCQENACIKRPKANSDSMYCCGPVKQTTKTLSCETYSINIVKTLECGCVLCNQVNISGNIITTRSDQVTFSGVAQAMDDPSSVLRFGEVYLFDERVDTTSFNGAFSFSVPIGINRIVVTFKEGMMKNSFVETSKVYNIPNEMSGTLFKVVNLLRKDKVKEIQSSEKSTISLAQSSGGSIAEVILPSNSFFKPDGSQYNGVVDVAFTFINPSDIDSRIAMVGDLTFINENGEVGSLKTFGMFHLGFNGENGEALSIKGDVGMAIRADAIGAGLENTTTVKLWSLNPSSARWEYEGSLERVSPSRRKRAESEFETDFFVGKTVITDRFWFNFDDDSLNYCFVRIKAYPDSSLGNPLQWSDKFEASVISMDVSSPDTQTGRVLTGSMSQTGSGYGSKDNCILTVCDQSTFHAYLFLESEGGALSASSILGGSSSTVTGVNIEVKKIDGTTAVTRSRIIETKVEPLTSNGPLYHSNVAPDCKDPGSTFCTDCETNGYADPLCYLCGDNCYTMPFMTAYDKCTKASDGDPHYIFYHVDKALFEYSVCDKAENCMSVQPTILPVAWFPQTNGAYWVWYIKVRVIVVTLDQNWNEVDSKDESTVRVVSKGGQHEDTKDKMFGIREDVTSDQSACIEFKGSGPIISASMSVEFDESIIDIFVEGTGCSVSEEADALKAYKVTTSPPDNKPVPLISYKMPSASIITGDKFGVYVDDDSELETAKKKAKARCECSDPQEQDLICQTPDPTSGVAVVVRCKDYDYHPLK